MQKGNLYQQYYSLDESVYQKFIDLFQDNNPLHTNEDFACNKGFRSKVMHGNILNGFLSHFIGECLPIKEVIIHSQSIHYSNPVFLGDELELNVVVEDYFDSVKIYEFKYSFSNQHKQKVAKGKITIGLL